MKKYKETILIVVSIVAVATSCSQPETIFSLNCLGEDISDPLIIVDPYGRSPLTAIAKWDGCGLSHSITEYQIEVKSKPGSLEEDLVVTLNPHSSKFKSAFPMSSFIGEGEVAIPILGLYPNYVNSVRVGVKTDDGTYHYSDVSIETGSVDIPLKVEIEKATNDGSMQPGMNFVYAFIHPRNPAWFYDKDGEVRWYMEIRNEDGDRRWPIERLSSGEFITGSIVDNICQFVTPLGEKTRTISISDYNGHSYRRPHHEFFEMPNGNLLVPIGKEDSDGTFKIESIIVEIDSTGKVIKEWDFDEIFMDILGDDNVLEGGGAFVVSDEDWLHINSIWYDARDNSLIISSQRWFVFKVGYDDKEIKWIFGDVGREWYTKFLRLQPYAVAYDENDVNFDPPAGQHTAKILPNGNLFLFNNRFGAIYPGGPHESEGYTTHEYSMGVEYSLDETGDSITATQEWQYGKERGAEIYAPVTSNVDLLENENRFIAHSSIGHFKDGTDHSSKIIEVDYSGNVIFEATVIEHPTEGPFYRSHRMPLYP